MAYESGNRPGAGRHGNGHGNGNGNGNGRSSYSGSWAATGSEQLREILHVAFKRKRLIGTLFLAVALPGVIATSLRKPSYVASAKVMISTQRSDPTLQPTDVTKLETIQLNESLVNSEVQVIGSRDLLERVVLSLAAPSNGAEPPHIQRTDNTFGYQVIGMGQNLTINPIKESNVIQIDFKSKDPSYAARVVNRVVDEYLAYHAVVHGNKGLSRFYDEQRVLLEKSLHKAEDALVSFSER